MKVSDILRVKGGTLFTVTPGESLSAALDVMSQHDIGSLVVMDHGELVGMLTFREVIQAIVRNGGSIGNTHFVAIPFNARSKAAAMVVANFLLEPATQAQAQDIKNMGSYSVLDLARLGALQIQRDAFLVLVVGLEVIVAAILAGGAPGDRKNPAARVAALFREFSPPSGDPA